jgi:hypothetical protein
MSLQDEHRTSYPTSDESVHGQRKKKTTGVAGQDVPHFKSFYGKIS